VLITTVIHTKTVEPIDMPIWVWSRGDPKGPDPRIREVQFKGGTMRPCGIVSVAIDSKLAVVHGRTSKCTNSEVKRSKTRSNFSSTFAVVLYCVSKNTPTYFAVTRAGAVGF